MVNGDKVFKNISVDPELWRRVKAQAIIEDKPLSEWVEAALLSYLNGGGKDVTKAIYDQVHRIAEEGVNWNDKPEK